MTVATGVSGSGRVRWYVMSFHKALKREYSEASERPGRVHLFGRRCTAGERY